MIAAASRSPRNDHVVTWLMHERHAGRRFQAFEAYFADFDSCVRRAPRVPNAFGTVDVLMKHSVTVNTVSLGDELTSIVVYGQHRDDRFQAASFC
jgi:molybdopterin synthase catalytic subunit